MPITHSTTGFGTLKTGCFGELYENNPGGSDIVMATSGEWYKWITSTVGLQSDPVNHVVCDAGDDDMTIGPVGAGVYKCVLTISFNGSNSANVHGTFFLNGAEQEKLEFHRKLGGADVGSASGHGLLRLAVGDVLDIRFSPDSDATTIGVEHLSATIVKVGD